MPGDPGSSSWKRCSRGSVFSFYDRSPRAVDFFHVPQLAQTARPAAELQEKLVPGAEVMTSFGLYATVVDIDDDTNVATIDAGGGTTLRVHRQVLTKVVDDEVEAPSEAEESGSESRDS